MRRHEGIPIKYLDEMNSIMLPFRTDRSIVEGLYIQSSVTCQIEFW
jgi:hypothetical protein